MPLPLPSLLQSLPSGQPLPLLLPPPFGAHHFPFAVLFSLAAFQSSTPSAGALRGVVSLAMTIVANNRIAWDARAQPLGMLLAVAPIDLHDPLSPFAPEGAERCVTA